jgi:alanine racemase
MLRRSWVEIDKKILKNNYEIYKSRISQNCSIMAVVKADAYGHGDAEIASHLQSLGVKDFAVSNVNEAIKLRLAGINGQILILGYTPLESLHEVKEFDATQTIIDENYARSAAKIQPKIKVQFAIDTGMKRIGLNADNPDYCAQIIRKYAEIFEITGIFSHLCVADSVNADDIKFTKKQIAKFLTVAEKVKDLHLPFIHCLNSVGGLCYEAKDTNLVRLGIILYGLKPNHSFELPNGIEPILTWKSVIAMTKTVLSGETIGYGRTFIAKRDMQIATIPMGYADGYNRKLSNLGFVLIDGQKAPIVGNVCMDQFMVDISEINSAKIGTEVILIGKSGQTIFTADDMANLIGTIGYEVVCNISPRVERVYIN